MARKDRVPSPPKRPQGPQRRSTPAAPAAAEQRRRLLLLVGVGAAALAAAVVGIVVLTGGGSGAGNERSVLEAAGCTLRSFPALPNKSDHSDVATLEAKPKWNSNPPTSGPHYGQWAVWGSYDEPVPLVQTVHNLEHGGVVIHYGPDVPASDVDAVKAFYSEDPNGLVVAPLPANGNKITLSAWTAPDVSTGTRDRGRGWLASCTKFDQDAFAAFLDAHRFKGPERIPPENLAPGS